MSVSALHTLSHGRQHGSGHFVVSGVEISPKKLKKKTHPKIANETTFVTSPVYAAAERGKSRDLSIFDGLEKTFPN